MRRRNTDRLDRLTDGMPPARPTAGRAPIAGQDVVWAALRAMVATSNVGPAVLDLEAIASGAGLPPLHPQERAVAAAAAELLDRLQAEKP